MLDPTDTYPFRSHRTMAQVMADEAAGTQPVQPLARDVFINGLRARYFTQHVAVAVPLVKDAP